MRQQFIGVPDSERGIQMLDISSVFTILKMIFKIPFFKIKDVLKPNAKMSLFNTTDKVCRPTV